MSTAVNAKKLLPTQRQTFTPLSSDVFVIEQLNVVQSPNDSIPAFGTPHDTMSKLQSWPNHKFCHQTPPDDEGNYTRWYIADQPTQQNYNWSISDAPDWKTITQEFVFPRASFTYPAANPTTSYPPPPNGTIDTTGYTITSTEQTRIGQEQLDNLYVAVRVTREKLTDTQTRYYTDLDTNRVQTETTQKALVGVTGSTVNASGQYTEVQPQNSITSLVITRTAQGLAGNAVNGVANRTIYYRDNYPWPPVLNYINIQAILSNPGDIYSPATGFSWQPVWLENAFNGPTNFTLIERWTLLKPVFGGDSDWNYGTAWATATAYTAGQQVNYQGQTYRCLINNTSTVFATDLAAGKWRISNPDVPEETPMLPQPIIFRGVDLDIAIGACLHEDVRIWDTQFNGFYPATNPPRWPATILSRVTVNPDQGGWLTRMFYTDAPNTTGVATGIRLQQTAATSTTFTLTWTIDAEVPAGTIKLDVATDPSFNSGFLSGYQNLTVTGTTLQVIGAERGQVYYARVSRGGVTSNICICLADPAPELAVTQGGQTILSGGTASIGSAEVGASISVTLALNSIGLEALQDFSATITGTSASMFTVSAMPVTLAPASTFEFTVQFSPTSTGTKTATLRIASNDSASPYLLTLTGIGVAQEIQVEQPVGTPLTDNTSTVDFGTVTTGSSALTFHIRNVGNATLRNIAGTITGDNAEDYTFTTPIASSELAAGAFQNFVITFDPVVNSSSTDTRTATLSIASNDADENPFTVNLTGVSQNPTAAGALDLTYDPNANGAVRAVAIQPDGKAVIGGAFTQVGATARGYIARLNTDGTLDSFNPGANGFVNAVVVQDDGSVVLAGEFSQVAATGRNFIARVDSTGALDSGFNPNANSDIYCLGIQSDGKIIAGGNFTTIGGGSKAYLARLNTDGTLDASFTSEVGTVATPGPVYGLQVLKDGRVAIVGDWHDAVPTPSPTPTPPPPTPSPSPPPPTPSPSPSPPPPSPSPSPPPSPSPSPPPSPSPSPPPPSPSPSPPPPSPSPSPPPPSPSPSPPPPTPSPTPSPTPPPPSPSPTPP